MANVADQRATVLEKRSRILYDLIENDQPGAAITRAEKYMTKDRNCHPAIQVIRALAFLRLGKDTEALNIMEKLDVDGAQHDEKTLSALARCYNETNLPKNICTLYERAVAWNPTDKYLKELFFAHVRVKDYSKQLAVAQRLWKSFGLYDYFYWYMLTLVMQARAFPEKAQLSYTIALKSLQSYIQKNGYVEPIGMMEIQLLVLDGLKSYKEALSLFNDKKEFLCTKPHTFLQQQELDLLIKNEKWEEAALYVANTVISNCDDWKSWSTYMDLIITVLQNPDLMKEKGDKFLTGFTKVLTDILLTDQLIQRGPYLAKLEMLYRLNINNIENSILSAALGTMGDNLYDYIKRFYKKPCCYIDIEKYLQYVQDDDLWYGKVDNFLTELYSNYKNQDANGQRESTIQASCENNGRVLLLHEKIKLRLGRDKYETRAKKFSMIAKLLDHEEELTNLSFTIEEASALYQCSGEVILMCLSALWKDWADKTDTQWLSITEAALLGEQAVKVVKYDYTSKLALCRFYSHIGALDLCRDLYKILDIKSVQQETLGYIIFHQFELCGTYGLGIKRHYESLSGYFTHADRELGETLANAVRNRAVHQATGIVELYDRVQKSTLQCANDVLSRYLSCLFSLKSVDEILSILEGDPEPIDWDGLCDNRELNLIPCYDCGNAAADLEREKTKSQREFVDITQLRHYICKALASVGLVQRCSPDTLRNNVVLLNSHIDHCRSSYPNEEVCRKLQTASPCRLGDWIHQGHLEPVMRLMKSAVQIALTHQEKAKLTPELLPTAKELTDALNGILPTFDSSKGPFYIHEPLFKGSRAFQSLAMCKLLTDFIHRRILSCLDHLSQKQRKANPMLIRSSELSNVVLDVLRTLNDILIDAFSHLGSNKSELVPPLDNDLYDGVVMTFMRDNYSSFVDRLAASYTTSFRAMTGLMAEHFNILPQKK